ncbi:hypothetical protein KVR01_010350 [Diaporthe batatas]|uniref:uncharacterized protein n=1 Tax=Diaporthe batatas TaxID=748121 RepID=UPI001D0396DA|nr:uncharacterized protein KVR01_010350 [Diaporthe batatas]KAG8159713.1 hypothetical protein KVR01_010350 [Diaporthe batatas]
MSASQPAPAPQAPQQGDNNARISQALQAIWRNHWGNIIDLFAPNLAASLRDQVLNELTAKRYEWSGNQFYRGVIGIDKIKEADLRKLKQWMYGDQDTTDATWRDTLLGKPEEERKADHNGRTGRVQSKSSFIDQCKLNFLLSPEVEVDEDPYWAGFLEEVAKDPDQTNLYDTVVEQMRIKEEDAMMEEDLEGEDIKMEEDVEDVKMESLEEAVRRLQQENDALRREIKSRE